MTIATNQRIFISAILLGGGMYEMSAIERPTRAFALVKEEFQVQERPYRT
jgi:hypothetical protein